MKEKVDMEDDKVWMWMMKEVRYQLESKTPNFIISEIEQTKLIN